FPVDLVAVVFGRIVARRDDDTRGRAEALDHEADERRRDRIAEQNDAEARTREDRGDVFGELAAHAPGVATDDHAALRRTRHALEQLAREPPGGPGHDGAVHAVGAGPEHAAEPPRVGQRGPYRASW